MHGRPLSSIFTGRSYCRRSILTTKTTPRLSRYSRTRYGVLDGDAVGPFVDAFTQQWDDTFIGVENPHWRNQVRRGVSAGTAASGSYRDHQVGGGFAYISYGTPGNKKGKRDYREVSGVLANPPILATSPNSYSLTAAEKQARLKFMAKYRSVRTAFQGGTFLGELGQTIRMIASPLRSLRSGIDDFYSQAKKHARRYRDVNAANKAIAGTWLEYSFGVRPLVNDIQDGLRLLDAQPTEYRKVISATADVDQEMQSWVGELVYGYLKYQYSLLQTGKSSVRYKGAVNASMERAPSFAEQAGLNLSNFVPTVYNLIPHSYLVDYFSNIGGVIDAASLGRVRLSWGMRTDRKINEVVVKDCRFDPELANAANLKSVQGSASMSGYRSVRCIWGRAPVDYVAVDHKDIQFRIPGIGEPLKWLNIAGLASLRAIPAYRNIKHLRKVET